MVTFIPPYMGEEIKSNAERKMYDVLQELNLKNACVLHSLGLPRHRSKIYGEIDFVVVCERGVACLEIKGGRVECHDGQWTLPACPSPFPAEMRYPPGGSSLLQTIFRSSL